MEKLLNDFVTEILAHYKNVIAYEYKPPHTYVLSSGPTHKAVIDHWVVGVKCCTPWHSNGIRSTKCLECLTEIPSVLVAESKLLCL